MHRDHEDFINSQKGEKGSFNGLGPNGNSNVPRPDSITMRSLRRLILSTHAMGKDSKGMGLKQKIPSFDFGLGNKGKESLLDMDREEQDKIILKRVGRYGLELAEVSFASSLTCFRQCCS